MVTAQLFFKRLGICLLWITLVFAFLYTPHFLQINNHKKCINVCMWPGVVDPKIIADQSNILNVIYELSQKYPTFGICMGHQLIALAYGANTKKLTLKCPN